MPRITKEPQERRQEILDTSMKLFYEKGYERTSITDIAREMGVAQGLCYRYFPSKEAIFDAALDEYAQVQVDQMTAGLGREEKSLRDLIREMPTFLDVERDDNFYYKVCHSDEGRKTHCQLSLKVCGKLLPIVERLLEKAVEKKEIQDIDPKTAASFCVYGQLGILLDEQMDGQERVERVKEFLTRLLDM